MTDDKAKLLRSLTIDRSAPSEPPRKGRRRLLLIATGAVACVAVAFGAFALAELRIADRPREAASQPNMQAQAQQPQQPQAPAGNDTGNLSASGYVVARRKATVAAEITGKVTELFIEEGMTVSKGDVIAQLRIRADELLSCAGAEWIVGAQHGNRHACVALARIETDIPGRFPGWAVDIGDLERRVDGVGALRQSLGRSGAGRRTEEQDSSETDVQHLSGLSLQAPPATLPQDAPCWRGPAIRILRRPGQVNARETPPT